MKLKVEQAKGNARFPRYVLVAENGTYYDGAAWTPDDKKALKYASLSVIKDDWKKLQKEIEDGLIELTGTYVVRITGLKEITDDQIESLAWFMSGASSFTLDYSTKRPLGLEHANISTRIVWGTLKRKPGSGRTS